MAKRKTRKKTPKGRKVTKISRLRKPEDMPLEQWQIALRKQFAQKQNFRLKNIGDEPIFSEFMVRNPQTGGEYRVAIRGQRIGDNYCSCPDFAVNTLGTCKHIEFTLAKLQRKRGGKKAFVYRLFWWAMSIITCLSPTLNGSYKIIRRLRATGYIAAAVLKSSYHPDSSKYRRKGLCFCL